MTSLNGQPSELVEAASTASAFLRHQELLDRKLNLEEALTLRAVATVAAERPQFYSREVARIVGGNPGNTSSMLRRFEKDYGILSAEAASSPGRGRKHRSYHPTALGETVLGFFAPPPPEPAADFPG